MTSASMKYKKESGTFARTLRHAGSVAIPVL